MHKAHLTLSFILAQSSLASPFHPEDFDLSDQLAEIPSVAIDKSASIGRKISIRGLSSEYGSFLLDGRKVTSLPHVYSGGRSVDLLNIPAIGVSSLEVYKTTQAYLPISNIAGVISVNTTKPLEEEHKKSFYIGTWYDDVSKRTSPESHFNFVSNGVLTGDTQWGLAYSGFLRNWTLEQNGTNEITWLPSDTRPYILSQVPQEYQSLTEPFYYPERLAYNNILIRSKLIHQQATLQLKTARTEHTVNYYSTRNKDNTEGMEIGAYFGGWGTSTMELDRSTRAVTSATHGPLGAIGDNVPWGFYGQSYGHDVLHSYTNRKFEVLGLHSDFKVNHQITMSLDLSNTKEHFLGTPVPNRLSFSNGVRSENDEITNPHIAQQLNGLALTETSFAFTDEAQPPAIQATFNQLIQSGFDTPVIGEVQPLKASDLGPRVGYLFNSQWANNLNQLHYYASWTNKNNKKISIQSVSFGYQLEGNNEPRQIERQQLLNLGKVSDGQPQMVTHLATTPDFKEKKVKSISLDGNSELPYVTISVDEAYNQFNTAGYTKSAADEPLWLTYAPWWSQQSTYGDHLAGSPKQWPSECIISSDTATGYYDSYGSSGVRTRIKGNMKGCYGPKDTQHKLKEHKQSWYTNLVLKFDESANIPIDITLGLRNERLIRTLVSYNKEIPTNMLWSLGAFSQGVHMAPETSVQNVVEKSKTLITSLPKLDVHYKINRRNQINLHFGQSAAQVPLPQLVTSSYLPTIRFDTQLPGDSLVATQRLGNINLKPSKSIDTEIAHTYQDKSSKIDIHLYNKRLYDMVVNSTEQRNLTNPVTHEVIKNPASTDRDNTCQADTDCKNSLCNYTLAEGDWACGWSSEYDWAWHIKTGFSFTCSGNDFCNPDPQNANAVFSPSPEDPAFVVTATVPKNEGTAHLRGIELDWTRKLSLNTYLNINTNLMSGSTAAKPTASYPLGTKIPGFGNTGKIILAYDDTTLYSKLFVNVHGKRFLGFDSYNPLYLAPGWSMDVFFGYHYNKQLKAVFEIENLNALPIILYARHPVMTFMHIKNKPLFKLGLSVSI